MRTYLKDTRNAEKTTTLLGLLWENAQAVLHLETESNWDPDRDTSGIIMKSLRRAEKTPIV